MDSYAGVDGGAGESRERIWFAEYGAMDHCAKVLRAECTKRAAFAGSAAERDWWTGQALATHSVVKGAVSTDRDDLVERCRMLTAEFERIGGFGGVDHAKETPSRI